MIIAITGLLILTGLDMIFNLGTQRRTIFPWTTPLHDLMVKIFDQHKF